MKTAIPLRVIQLSTGHEGGAGLAARRLNSALNVEGIDSKFGALEHSEYHPEMNEFSISRKFLQRLISGLLVRIQTRLSKKVLFSLLSLNVFPYRRIAKLGKPDEIILHFHNWFNLVSQSEILKLCKRGYLIVLTMHDERFFTGGCHYTFDCNEFKVSCNNCPELPVIFKSAPSRNLKNAKRLMKKSEGRITFITPSNWLYLEALSSNLLSASNITCIPNTLGTDSGTSQIVSMRNKPRVNDTLSIGIASMARGSYIKGGDITSEIETLTKSQNLPFRFIYLSDPEIQKDSAMRFWAKIDYLLVASRAENSPNVIHEAKSFGIPVIASDIGGISELLTKDFDISIPRDQINTTAILNILLNINRKDPVKRAELMSANFHKYVKDSVALHQDLYRSIYANKNKV